MFGSKFGLFSAVMDVVVAGDHDHRVLSASSGAPAPRVTRFLVPPAVQHHRRAVDQIADDSVLARVRDGSDEELAELVAQLGDKERELSRVRRSLLDRIDALQSELTGRYKSGSASVAELLSRPT